MLKNILFAGFVLFSPLVFAGENQLEKHGEFSGAKPTQMPSWFKESFLDLAEDIREEAEVGKRIMVFFHQDGCPYCNLLVEDNFADKDTQDKIRAGLEVVEINMWGDREVISVNGRSLSEKQFAVAKKVQFTPTLIFFNENGKEVLRLNGYLPKAEFNQALDFVIGKHETVKFRDFVRKNLKIGGELIAEPDLFLRPPYDLAKLQAADKPFALVFEAGNCVNCEKLHQNVLTDKTTRDIFKKLELVQLDVNSQRKINGFSGKSLSMSELADSLNINFTPTIVFYDQGKEIIRSEALFKIFHTQSMADYVISGAYKSEPEFQRYLSARADKIIETGKDVDIWR